MGYMYICMCLGYVECNTVIVDCEILQNINIFKKHVNI
jgi:hypothetical protein